VTTSIPVAANYLDQNGNGKVQEYPPLVGSPALPTPAVKSSDVVAVPTPVNGHPFQLPYVQTSLPLSIPGPHVTRTFVPGQSANVVSATQSPAVASATRQSNGTLAVTFASAPTSTLPPVTSVVERPDGTLLVT